MVKGRYDVDMNLSGIHFGQMDTKVTIEQPTELINSVTGERTVSAWTTFKKVWSKRMSLSDEKFEANQAILLTGNAYMIRYLSGVTSLMRVNDGDSYFYIKGIETVDRKQYMVLKTEQRDNG